MASKDGVIRQKDIIEDKALTIGKQYADNMNQAISANKELVESLKAINKLAKEFRNIKDTAGYITAKQQQALETQRLIDAIKRQEAAQLALDRVETAHQRNQAAILATTRQRILLETQEANLERRNANNAKAKRTAQEIFDQGVLAKNARNLAILNSKLSTEYEKLTVKQRMAATTLQNILIAGKKADETQAQYNTRLRIAQAEFDGLNRSVIQANRAIGRFNDNVGNYPKEAGQQIRDLMGAFGVVVGVDLFVTSLQGAFDVIRNFEAEMVNLAAIAGYSRAEIAPLEADIRAVAAVSVNSATEVAQLATELVKLGSTPEEVSKLLKPVNDLSLALQASAEDSATLVKSILNAYQQGAEEAGHVTDVLAESANRSALDFAGLRDAFSYVAPVANTLGISIEKTASLIGILADNGIKAESAGRLLSTGLGKLAGEGLTLEQALDKINKAQKDGKSSLDVLTVANNLFGVEAGKLALILANNRKKIDENTEAYKNSNGALKELTDKQLKSINSELEILSSAWEEYILNTNEAADGTRIMTDVLSFLSSNLNTIANVLLTAAGIWGIYKASIAAAKAQAYLMSLASQINTLTTVENTIATEAATVATVAETVAEDANTAALTAQILALEGNTVAEVENTVATDALAASHTANVVAVEAETVATTAATGAMAKFNAVLKANALFLIITALVGIIYLYNKFNKSVQENYQELKKSTDEFLKNKDAANKNIQSIEDLSDRYDELKSKTKLSKDEQKELNEIIKVLSETVPGATTQMDKYGNAIAINTTKTREYIKAKQDMLKAENALKLEQNEKLLKSLQKEQQTLNLTADKYNGTIVEGIGVLIRRNGLILKLNSNTGNFVALTKEELALYSTKRFQNEEAIANTLAQIKALKGLTDAQKANKKAAEDKAKEDAKNAPRTIEVIDAEISALEDSIKLLSDKTGKEGNIIKQKIKNLKAERELIYSTTKENEKDYERLARKQLDLMKRVRDAIYNLNQFRLQNAIDTNQLIIDDERKSVDERIDAYTENEQLRQDKSQETLKYELLNQAIEGQELEKLTKKKRDLFFKSANDRIQAILEGKIANDKLNNSELLLLEKFNAEQKKSDQQALKDKKVIADSQVEILRKQMEFELMLQDTKLNNALEAENKLYLASITNQTNLEQAQQEHERKILEIKKSFAKQGLDVQIDAVQKLIDNQKKLPENQRISYEKMKELENQLANLRKENSDIDVENSDSTGKKKLFFELENFQQIEERAKEVNQVLVDLAGAIFDKKIQNIEIEQEKNNEYYDKQIELAKDDEKQKALLEKERDKKNEALEKKKKKEQHKQAVFNKAMALTEAGFNTAQAITAALTAGPGIGLALAVITAAVAAVQLAAIAATPIPKYKGGRKGGKKEVAEINDGRTSSGNYVPEVVESKDGTAKIYEGSNRLVQLMEGDNVYKSVEDFTTAQRKKIGRTVLEDGKKANEFQQIIFVKENNSKQMISKIDELITVTKRNKPLRSKEQKSLDLNHELWKIKNIKS